MQQESWGQTTDPVGFGTQWITDHETSGKAANKPVILEEFGVTDNQASTYTTWYNTIITSGLTGDLIWCVAFAFGLCWVYLGTRKHLRELAIAAD